MTLAYRTDFALRTLMLLADRSESRATTSEIAQALGIPVNHLVKVVNELSRRDYVRTVRGPGGGVELAQDATQIRLGQVIEDFQGPLRLHDCVVSSGICAIETICRLQGILRQADEVQARFLDQFSLADITPKFPVREKAKSKSSK